MATIDLVSNLLPGILSAEGRRRQEATQALTSQAQPTTSDSLLAGLMSPMPQQTQTQQTRTNIGRLFGLDTRPPMEKLQEQLAGMPLTTAADYANAAQVAKDLGLSAQAIQLSQKSAQLRTEEQKTAAQSMNITNLQNTIANAAIQYDRPDIADAAKFITDPVKLQELFGQVNEAKTQFEEKQKETREFARDATVINRAADLVSQRYPNLAVDMTEIFAGDAEGARDFTTELLKAEREGNARDIFTETIVNTSTGMPEVVAFDKKDENYRRILGVDDSALSANKGKPFKGKLQNTAGTAIPDQAFDSKAHAEKLLELAFNPNLEWVVGPSEARRLLPDFMMTPEAVELRSDISRSQVTGYLPIIRALAPVTEQDVQALKETQLNFNDTQEVWIKKTITEKIPQALNVLYNRLNEEGMSLGAAHQLAMSSYELVLDKVTTDPNIFGSLNIEEMLDEAYELLPDASFVDRKELPANKTYFKTADGKILSETTINSLVRRRELEGSNEEIAEQIATELGLELFE